MPHAHLTVYHLLQQLEADRDSRAARDRRPQWLSDAIAAAAELFEPIEGVARVGFQCRPTEEGWIADLYLGREEHVGGARDGWNRPASFRFDLLALEQLFDQVFEVYFDASLLENAGPDDIEQSEKRIFATLRGEIADNPLTIHIHAAAPAGVHPGFRRYADGRREICD